jgi:hypothetical protein
MNTFRETPLVNLESDYLTISLVNRGLADTRAFDIVEALNTNEWDKLAMAILRCDEINFPLLLKIEPVLFELCLKNSSYKKVLIDNLKRYE